MVPVLNDSHVLPEVIYLAAEEECVSKRGAASVG